MNSHYRRDVDGLRAVAVAAVVVFHAFPEWAPGGFVGVDIFFVISGFVITGTLLRDAAGGGVNIVRFYEKRVRRIFPALIVVLTACLAFGWLALFPLEYEQLGRHALAGVFFVSNIQLWSEAGYFDPAGHFKPLLHLWSLGIEEQFYLIWPLIIWAALRLRLALIIVITALGLASFYLNVAFVTSDPIGTFYLPHTRFWELLIGAGLAVIARQGFQIGGLARNICSFLGLGLIAVTVASLTGVSPFPGWSALMPTIGAALIILAGERAWLNRTILANNVFVWLGLISYPLYLWHWPLLSFAHIVESGPVPFNERVALVAVAVILAALTFWLVELPIRKRSGVGIKSTLVVPPALAAMLSLGAFGYYVVVQGGLESRPPIQHANAIASQFVGPLWKYSTNEDCMGRYPLDGVETFGWWFCITNSERPPEILLMGTSLANQIYPGLISNDAFSRKSILSIGTCDPIWVDPERPVGEEAFSPCSGDRPIRQAKLIDEIIAAGTIKYILIAGLPPAPSKDYIEAFRRRLDLIEASGATAIVFTPYVAPSYDVRSCFARPFKASVNSCVLDIEARSELMDRFEPLRDSIATTNPSVRFFDTNELFCDTQRCSMILDGMPMLRDEFIHWSEFASSRAADMLVEWAAENAPGLTS